MTSLRKRVAVGVVGLAVVAGGGIAVAAGSGSSGPRDTYLDNVAKRLNVTPDKLREAMNGAAQDMRTSRVPRLRSDPRPHFGLGLQAFGADIRAVAKYLGLSSAELREHIADGKSLADIAKTQKKDLDGLKKLLTERFETHLDDLLNLSLPKGLAPGVPRLHGGGPGFHGPPGTRGGPRGRFGFGLGAFGADIETVAKYLGLSARELREQIAGGTSLADIAKAQGKDVAGLEKVITDAVRKRFGDAAADRLADHLDELLELSLPKGLRRHP